MCRLGTAETAFALILMGLVQQWPCGSDSQTTEYLLQSCPLFEALIRGIWLHYTPVIHKLYGSLKDLQWTATFIADPGASIRQVKRKKTPAGVTGAFMRQQISKPNAPLQKVIVRS